MTADRTEPHLVQFVSQDDVRIIMERIPKAYRSRLRDVFLHELGHLQPALPKSKNWKRKYAGEKLAQDFADECPV